MWSTRAEGEVLPLLARSGNLSSGTISVLPCVIMMTIPETKETLMANEVIAVISVLAAVSICVLIVHMRHKARREPSHDDPQARMVHQPVQTAQSRPRKVGTHRCSAAAARNGNGEHNQRRKCFLAARGCKESVAFQAQATPEGSNQRILAGISENLRRSVIKPVPTYSTVSQPEAQRDPEYVRVKKRIITPHGQVRFSILKDSVSVNMLAVFRRAFLDWKTPYDLIAFLPAYLEVEAEIFHDQLLLIGTAGHHEKLAIPIRSFNLDSNVLDCFDFITDDRTATNTPAVLAVCDDEIEIVCRGVITQPVFLKPERDPSDVKFLVERYPQALHNG
jgi:hypothetical protein